MKKFLTIALFACMSCSVAHAAGVSINDYPVIDSKCEMNQYEKVSCQGSRDAIFKLVDNTMDKVFAQSMYDYPDKQLRIAYFATTSNRIRNVLAKVIDEKQAFIFEAVKYQIDKYLIENELVGTNLEEICELVPELCMSIEEIVVVEDPSCGDYQEPVCGVKNICTNYRCYQNTKTYQSHCDAEADGADYIKPGLCDQDKTDFIVEDISYMQNYGELGPGLLAEVCNIGGDVFVTHDDSFVTKFTVEHIEKYVPFQGGWFYSDECKEVFISVMEFDNLNKGLHTVRVEADADDLIREESDINNRKVEKIRFFAKTAFGADFYIKDIIFDAVEQNLLFEVCNANEPFEGFLMIRVEVYGAVHDIVQNTVLRRNECDIFVSHIDDLSMKGGRNYYMTVTVDPIDQVGESNEKNNTVRESMTLRDDRPDLYIADITETFVLSKHYATVKICNEKTRYEGDLTLRMLVNGKAKEVNITTSLSRLFPCVEYPFSLESFGIRDGHSQGLYIMRAYVDPYDSIDEMYEENNFFDKEVYAN